MTDLPAALAAEFDAEELEYLARYLTQRAAEARSTAPPKFVSAVVRLGEAVEKAKERSADPG